MYCSFFVLEGLFLITAYFWTESWINTKVTKKTLYMLFFLAVGWSIVINQITWNPEFLHKTG